MFVEDVVGNVVIPKTLITKVLVVTLVIPNHWP